MKLIALLVGLLVERFATQFFHLRRFRWLDRAIDKGLAFTGPSTPPRLVVVVLAFVLALPVFLAVLAFGDAFFGVAFLVVAVIVLFFSFGPADIGMQVDDYCAALEEEDEVAIRQTAKALTEKDVDDDPLVLTEQVEAAVCIQANNRLFAVIFWFVLFGPIGAWGYRVTDLIRRRAVFNAGRETESESAEARELEAIVDAATQVHGWLAWIPARLTALGFALAGSFDNAIAAWRDADEPSLSSPGDQSERLLARVGRAALALNPVPGEEPSERGVRGALAVNGLVFRLLGIWAVVIAAMTLYGASL